MKGDMGALILALLFTGFCLFAPLWGAWVTNGPVFGKGLILNVIVPAVATFVICYAVHHLPRRRWLGLLVWLIGVYLMLYWAGMIYIMPRLFRQVQP